MGVTIYYQGQLDRLEDLPGLVEELADIAGSMAWEFTRIERDEKNSEFAGIVLSPSDNCESISFLFDRDGRLRNILDLVNGQIEPTHNCPITTSLRPSLRRSKPISGSLDCFVT